MNEFAKRLRLIREFKGISLSKVSLETNIPKGVLSRYENNLSVPSFEKMNILSKYFHVSLDWFAGDGDIDTIKLR